MWGRGRGRPARVAATLCRARARVTPVSLGTWTVLTASTNADGLHEASASWLVLGLMPMAGRCSSRRQGVWAEAQEGSGDSTVWAPCRRDSRTGQGPRAGPQPSPGMVLPCLPVPPAPSWPVGSRLCLHLVLSSCLGQHLQRCSEMKSLSRDFKAGLRNLTDSNTIHFLKLLTNKMEAVGPGYVWEPSGLISRHLMGSFFVLIFPVKGPINPDFPGPAAIGPFG